MESAQTIKRRLKSVANVGQITKAMELVAATKMRKSQEIALQSRPYAWAALELLARVSGQKDYLPKLLQSRKVKKSAFVLVASDKGLAGSFNSAVTRAFEGYLRAKKLDVNSPDYCFIAIGEKANTYLQSKGIKVFKKFIRAGDFTTPEQTNPILNFLAGGYLEGSWDEVILFSTYFKSALKQEVLTRKVFPVGAEDIKETVRAIIPATGKFSELLTQSRNYSEQDMPDDYLIEPSRKKVLEKLALHLVRMDFYHLILEANASEHAARRVAMKNASDNAKELSENLNIIYNKSRQSAITREITEITSSVESLN